MPLPAAVPPSVESKVTTVLTVRVTSVENVAVTDTSVSSSPSASVDGITVRLIVEDTVSSSVIVISAGLTVLNPAGAVPLIVIVSSSSSTESSTGVMLSPVAEPGMLPSGIVTDDGSPVAV